MAHLVRPWVVRYVHRTTGQRVPKGDPAAKVRRERSAKWYGQGLPGQGRKRFPLATDKNVAKRMLADLVEKFERGIAHMPERDEAGQALEPLVKEFEEGVGRKAKESHVKQVVCDVRRVLDGCKLGTVSDLNAKDLAGRVEQFVWALMEGDDGLESSTAAYVGKHARQFTRWLWRKRKVLEFDPLAGVDLPSQDTQNHRRPLTPEELAAVMAAAEASTEVFRYRTGADRAVIYLVAAATGYRAGELAKLTPAHFDLDGQFPVVRLKGKNTKNKKAAEQPLPPLLAARLRSYLQGRPADQPVWPGTWYRRAADMLRIDMKAAGIPGVVDDEEALFHSLRHTYTTLLAKSAPVKVTQELARHSTPVLTLGRYSHTDMKEKAEAVARLPLPGANVAAGPFAAMSRAELEATAGALLVALLASSVAPRVAPDLATAGERERGSETDARAGR